MKLPAAHKIAERGGGQVLLVLLLLLPLRAAAGPKPELCQVLLCHQVPALPRRRGGRTPSNE